ncbi:putative porin [Trinickia symbiotica]|uniref:Porin n=2 Tax=Trinickia symbiotica TaxID=863227 RepID=A0A2N7WTH4_9BURK|nr:porin [Trinickia symbiotica]PMS32697.1 porin [Trinickia symbiotica]PPK41757.1 putative porin [Trinickia symbiotica]
MKGSFLIPAVAFFAATQVYAQSSVTIYGRLDNGIQYETGYPKGKSFSASTGNYGESWLGLKGQEDLGGGTQVFFKLESGLLLQNGSVDNGNLFSRNATVGVSNDKYGSFRVGNLGAYENMIWLWFLDPQLMEKYAVQTLVRGRDWSRTGNGFEYTSPTFGGLFFSGQYDVTNSTSWNAGTPGSGPGQLGGAQGRSDSLRVQYEGHNILLQTMYDEIRDPQGKFSNVYVHSRSFSVGGAFTFGPVKISTGYQHLSAPDASNQSVFGTASAPALPGGVTVPTAADQEWIGASWQATPFTSIQSAVYHANANHGNGNATMYTLTGSYSLSKRTLLYTELAYVHNSSTSNIGLNNGYSDPYGPNVNNDPVNGGARTSPNYGHGQFGAFAGIFSTF